VGRDDALLAAAGADAARRFRFRSALRPSTIVLPGMPDGVIACMPLLDDWGVPSRLATLAGFPGCFDALRHRPCGHLARLARGAGAERGRDVRLWPDSDAAGDCTSRGAVSACPARVSLEEFMACAVGGCAGCAVPVVTESGLAMKRVCVDGPVFDANAVFPPRRSGSRALPWQRLVRPRRASNRTSRCRQERSQLQGARVTDSRGAIDPSESHRSLPLRQTRVWWAMAEAAVAEIASVRLLESNPPNRCRRRTCLSCANVGQPLLQACAPPLFKRADAGSPVTRRSACGWVCHGLVDLVRSRQTTSGLRAHGTPVVIAEDCLQVPSSNRTR